MKKLSVFCASCFVLSAFAYTSEDVSNATYLSEQGIVTKQTTATGYRLDDTILRQEVIGMALKIKGITLPENYKCKKYFADATQNNWECRAVELAADNGIITRSNTYANPGKLVTRAEAFSIIYNASGLTPSKEYGTYIIQDKDVNTWQMELFFRIHNTDLKIPGEIIVTTNNPSQPVYFYPNRLATRAEVFGFAKNVFSIGNKGCGSCQKYSNAFEAKFPINIGKYYDESTNSDSYNFGYHEGNSSYSIEVYGGSELSGLLSSLKYTGNGFLGNRKYYIFLDRGMLDVFHIVFPGKYKTILFRHSDIQTVESMINALEEIDFNPNVPENPYQNISPALIIGKYYGGINENGPEYLKNAYDMRSPAGVSFETFQSWYKNTTNVIFREDTLKNLGDNTYEFLVDMTENSVKSTYKVKSKVDLENFKINNISSVKQ